MAHGLFLRDPYFSALYRRPGGEMPSRTFGVGTARTICSFLQVLWWRWQLPVGYQPIALPGHSLGAHGAVAIMPACSFSNSIGLSLLKTLQ